MKTVPGYSRVPLGSSGKLRWYQHAFIIWRGQLPGHWWKTKMFLAKDSCAVLHNTVGSLFYTFAIVLGRLSLSERTFLGKQNAEKFHKSWVICLGCLSLLHLQYLSSTWHIISSQQIPAFLNE